ncbi:anthranilate synthase component 1 [Aestuariibacter sp. AA17]|uniref:Anthranilate synthase component 1 n=1 Tax=Fluctibacter corallii TaxID=2984329 RepID=A0ABT3A5K4_9ALTE|nr:anthranilate synthase component 1 [Aestuariibacter sp. AA17]MCV2883862.1 anthranilate synthase component 1 [Aestuariibacter sp. AA17]
MSLTQLSEQLGKVETLVRSASYIADPLSAYEYLCANQNYNVLLESAEIDSKDNLKSLILTDAAVRLECQGLTVFCKAVSANGEAVIQQLAEYGANTQDCNIINHTTTQLDIQFSPVNHNLDEDSRLKSSFVLAPLREMIRQLTPIRNHPDSVFLAGAFAYDLLGVYEQLPEVEMGDNTCPDYVFYLAETLIIIDHQRQSTEVLGNIFSGPNVASHYFNVSQRVETLVNALETLPESPPSTTAASTDIRMSKSDEEFKQDVLALKEHILAGDIFQVVPSRTFSLECPNPYAAYRELKKRNPSPYMFYLKDDDFAMFGASPESALKYEQETNQVEIYPIAGTRPRGKREDGSLDLDLDSRLELALREDHKEKAEHLMLVDLARNDVARVSKPGSRHVKDLLKVDRYSHVMHLVSRVVGELRDDLDALHAYQACMNMGTLVGAPKVSAASLIREVEKTRRGSYGGAVGYLNAKGDMDSCIVIRSAFVRNGKAYIQAGAGVVYDSDPQAEADETRGKAQAVISAIQAANQGVSA